MKIELTMNTREAREAKFHLGEIISIAEKSDLTREYQNDMDRVWNAPAQTMRLTGGEGRFAIGDRGCTLTYDFNDDFVIKVMHVAVEAAKWFHPIYTACKSIIGMARGAAEPIIDKVKSLTKEYGPRTEKVLVRLYNNPGIGVIMMVVEEINQFNEHNQQSWYHIKNESGIPVDQLHHLTEGEHGEAYMATIREITDPELIGDQKRLQAELDRINDAIRNDVNGSAIRTDINSSKNHTSSGIVRYFGFDLVGMSNADLVELRSAAYSRRKDLSDFPDYDWKMSDRQQFKDLTTNDLTELIRQIDMELSFRKY